MFFEHIRILVCHIYRFPQNLNEKNFTAETKKCVLHFLPSPFLAVASLISFLGFQNVYTHHLAENWPTTEATILRAEVQNRDDLHQNISDRTRLSQYIPKIEYSYRIENKEYIGNRIQTGGIWSSSDSSVAKEIVQKYKGRSVRIYYNPENPTESYLERSGIFRAYSIGIISGLFSVFIFLILIRIWKIKK